MNAVPSQPRALSDRPHSLRTFSWTAGMICRSKKFIVLMPRSTPRVNTRRGGVVPIGWRPPGADRGEVRTSGRFRSNDARGDPGFRRLHPGLHETALRAKDLIGTPAGVA